MRKFKGSLLTVILFMTTPLLAQTPADREESHLYGVQRDVVEELRGVERGTNSDNLGQFSPEQDEVLARTIKAYNKQGSPYLD